MRFLAINDLHLTHKRPESRTDADFPEELFELLDQLGQLAHRLKVRAVLIAGDVFHGRVNLPVFARFARWCLDLKAAAIDVVAIPGNHDEERDRYESIEQLPFGLLERLGVVLNVSTTRGIAPVVYAPSIESGERAVAIEGVPYPDAFDLDAWRTLRPRYQDVPPDARPIRIVLGHCFVAPLSGDLFGQPVHSYADLAVASGADYLIFGHDHTDRGVTQLAALDDQRPDVQPKPVWIVDLGAISRGSIALDDIAREPKCVYIETAACEVVQVRFRARPADQLFDLAKKARRDAERVQVETFVSQLRADLVAISTTGASVEDRLRGMSLPAEVLARVEGYIHAVEASTSI